MRGASRASFAALTDQLAAENITSATVATRLGDELFAVVGLLDAEPTAARADRPGTPAAEKGAIAGALLHGKVTQPPRRWSWRPPSPVVDPGDLADATEQLAIVAWSAAQADGGLDDLEDELFRFGRVVAGSRSCAPRWPALAARGTQARLLDALLEGKVTPATLRLISQVAVHPRGVAWTRAWTSTRGWRRGGGSG